MQDLGKIVGENQRRLRTEQGLSLDALAKASGVSRSRLAQIEQGEANPSISTVWQIANALRTEFSALLTSPQTESVVVSKKDISPVTGEDKTARTYLLFPHDPASGFAFYESEIDPGGQLTAQGHPSGEEETISVTAGELTLVIAEKTYKLTAGDAIRFRADQQHEYRNDGRVRVDFTMVVAYPRKG